MTVPDNPIPFTGFEPPKTNFFKVPNIFWDIEDLTVHERFVLLYILRHTWGYQEFGIYKRITIDEFQNGRKTHDGNRMDKGCGVSRGGISNALTRLAELGYILVDVDASDPARIKKSYTLNMMKDSVQLMNAEFTGRTQSSSDGNRTEKETTERNLEKETKKESLSPDKATSSDSPDEFLPVIETAQETADNPQTDESDAVEEKETENAEDYQLPQFMKLAIFVALSKQSESVVEKAEAHIAALEAEVIPKASGELPERTETKTPKQIQDEYQEIIRRVFGEWADEKSPPELLQIGHTTTNLMKFFRGMHTSGKKSLMYQLEAPWSTVKIAALYAYYRRTYKNQNRVPRSFDVLRGKCDEFDALPVERQQRYLDEGQRLVDRVLSGNELDTSNPSNGARFDNLSVPKPEDYKRPEWDYADA